MANPEHLIPNQANLVAGQPSDAMSARDLGIITTTAGELRTFFDAMPEDRIFVISFAPPTGVVTPSINTPSTAQAISYYGGLVRYSQESASLKVAEEIHTSPPGVITLAKFLLSRPDTLVTRREIMEGAWGISYVSARNARTVDVHILRLRRIFEDKGLPGKELISSIRKRQGNSLTDASGYMFNSSITL